MSNPSISKLTEFLSWVEANRPEHGADEYAMFYRGHSNADYKLEPTVYRPDAIGKTFRAVEHQLYEEMFRHSPSSFAEDRNLFERIVRMQHHGLPTRLLDLTQSPLVALYFACNSHAAKGEEKGKDGEVIFLPRKRMAVLHSSDIPEAALAGIEQGIDIPFIVSQITTILAGHFEANFQRRLEYSKLDAEFQLLMQKSIQAMRALDGCTDLFEVATVLRSVEGEIKLFVENGDKEASELERSSESTIDKLALTRTCVALMNYCRVFDEKVSNIIASICGKLRFRTNVEYCSLADFLTQFTQYHFAFPPMNNARIRQQQGAFIICPPGRTIHWPLEKFQSDISRIRINASSKNSLLSELSYFGITQSSIYPDLNIIAIDAKMKYGGTVEEDIKRIPF